MTGVRVHYWVSGLAFHLSPFSFHPSAARRIAGPGPACALAAACRWIAVLAAAVISIALVSGRNASAETYWSGGNQLEYSLAREGGREILEDWFDMEWSSDDLSAGLRYEMFHPHEMSPDSTNHGIPFKYLNYSSRTMTLTVGNFYTLFGRGLALRTYEDRGIRKDSNLEGIKLEMTSGPAGITLLSGKTLNQRGEHRDLLHGLDINVEPLGFLRAGLSYLSNSAPRQPGTRTHELTTWRVQLATGSFDLYLEKGNRSGSWDFCSTDHDQGRGFYGAVSLALDHVGISVEHKDYRGFRFLQSDCATEYNLPPALIREHTFTLLNRHPHELDSDDEKGTQVEILASAGPLGDFLISSSKTDNQDGRLQFQETYFQWEKTLESGQVLAAVDFAKRPEQNQITLVGEAKTWFREEMSVKAQLQHQHVDGLSIGQYDDDLFLVEFSPSVDLSFSLIAEYTNKSELQTSDPGERTNWLHGIVTRSIGTHHYASLMYGTRQAGFLCAGGVCRYEPAFDGLEFKLFSTF
ncbi:MAG: hypothetical protein KAW17_00520 [Candidatus Eisenbacteria sp.]|nr:hypothetical protein [Candidatus Eisenbacteria bacterium]